MRIGYLCDCPEHTPELAAAHLEAFGAMLPDWSLPEALAELRSHTRRRAIPTTLVALAPDGGDWLGSVSLLQNDDARIRRYSPWLASLYVRPGVRSSGVGHALVARCIDEARALGVQRLHLYCESALTSFYARLGWIELDRQPLGGVDVTVMAVALHGDLDA